MHAADFARVPPASRHHTAQQARLKENMNAIHDSVRIFQAAAIAEIGRNRYCFALGTEYRP